MSKSQSMSTRPSVSKRRSTFGRRKSRSLGALATNEICKTIDKSLPTTDRLQLLIQYAIETAFSKASQETDEADDFEVSKRVSAAQVEIESEIETQNLYSLAVSNDKNTDKNVSQHVNIAQYNAAIAKLQEEERQWDAAMAKEREELEKEINLRKIEFKGPLDKKKLNFYNYSNLLEDVSFMNSNLSYMVSRLKSTREKINTSVKLTESSLAGTSTKIESYFEATYKESPKTLIKNCFSENAKEA